MAYLHFDLGLVVMLELVKELEEEVILLKCLEA